MLRYAQKRISHLPNTELIELPDCNLSPIPDHAVDIVYCSIVFMHLEEWDRYEYVKEAFRVLKPGGRAYFDNFSLTTNEGWRIFEAHYEMDYRPSQISKSSTKEELKEYLIRSNFVKVNTDTDEPWAIAVGEKIKNTFFIHIPKTGGLFLRECFKEIMLENKFLPESEHDSLSNQSFFCSEHIPFYEAKLKLDNVENHFLFTFLREPYDHLISHISWLGNLNERPDSEKDFFDDGVHELSEKIRFTDFENQAEVKVLVNDLPYCGVKFFDNCFTRYLGNDEIEERVSFEDVEIALANLKNFSFVGSFEQMELSVNKLFTKLGIALSGIDFSRKINSSNPKKISNIELHEPIKKVLFPLVEKDLIIYREAKKRLLV
jgi:SAM-dependent methyltransferase